MKLFVYDKTNGRNLFVLLAFCFLVRIVYQWININIPFFRATAQGVVFDEYGYIAEALAGGDGFSYKGVPTALVPPLYPLVLGALYKLFGIWRGYGLIFQAVCDTCSCFFIFLLAGRIFKSYQKAFLAALVWTVYIPGIHLTVLLYSEPLFIAMLTFFFYSLVVVTERPSPIKWALIGLQLGLLYLCRTSALFLLPVTALYLSFKVLKKSFFKTLCIMFFSFGLISSPWVIRNYNHSGRWISSTTKACRTLCQSRDLIENKELVLEIKGLRQPRGILLEYKKNLVYRKYFLEKLKNKPAAFLARAAKHIRSLYLYRFTASRVIFMICSNVLLLVLAGISIWKYRGEWSARFTPFWLFLGYFHLMAVFPVGDWRHNMPNIPLLIILAVPALTRIFRIEGASAPFDRGIPGAI